MRKDWIITLIVTFIALMSWVIFDILHTRSSVEISPKLQQALEPVDPNFDTEILDQFDKQLPPPQLPPPPTPSTNSANLQ